MSAKYPSWEPSYRKDKLGDYYQRNPAKYAEKLRKTREHYALMRAYYREKNRAYYILNKAELVAKNKAYRAASPKKAAEQRRKCYRRNHAYRLKKALEYSETRRVTGKAADYRNRTRDAFRKKQRERSANVTDGYARELLSKNCQLSPKDFPQELVELKKIEIKLKRELNKNEKCDSTAE